MGTALHANRENWQVKTERYTFTRQFINIPVLCKAFCSFSNMLFSFYFKRNASVVNDHLLELGNRSVQILPCTRVRLGDDEERSQSQSSRVAVMHAGCVG